MRLAGGGLHGNRFVSTIFCLRLSRVEWFDRPRSELQPSSLSETLADKAMNSNLQYSLEA
jgi:hypothetical protein